MRVKVDGDLCDGCGMCVSFCPDLFGVAPSGKATSKLFRVPQENQSECTLAIEICPRSAIRIVTRNTD